MKKKHSKTKKGFTLVELSLAVAFISLILLIMATLTISLIAIYRKGITINAVNSVGRSIIEDFQNSVSETNKSQSPESICGRIYSDKTDPSGGYNKCVSDNARKLIYNEIPESSSGKPFRGVFCTGSYSYIWNTPYAGSLQKMLVSPGFSTGAFKLLKVYDEDRRACAQLLNEYVQTNNRNISFSGSTTPQELISQNDTNLAVYHVYVAPLAINSETSNVFYSGSFILATEEGGVNVMAHGDYCKPPGDTDTTNEENFNYCAINKFNFAVQGNGG